jgi:hypothetical protein
MRDAIGRVALCRTCGRQRVRRSLLELLRCVYDRWVHEHDHDDYHHVDDAHDHDDRSADDVPSRCSVGRMHGYVR